MDSINGEGEKNTDFDRSSSDTSTIHFGKPMESGPDQLYYEVSCSFISLDMYRPLILLYLRRFFILSSLFRNINPFVWSCFFLFF